MTILSAELAAAREGLKQVNEIVMSGKMCDRQLATKEEIVVATLSSLTVALESLLAWAIETEQRHALKP